MKPWFVLPLVGNAMAFSTHFILNAFSSVLWKTQGISEAAIGLLIPVGALAETGIAAPEASEHTVLADADASLRRDRQCHALVCHGTVATIGGAFLHCSFSTPSPSAWGI
jgi:hypothetical protein